MKLFRNLNVGVKLLYGFCAMIALMIVVGFVGYWNVYHIKSQLDGISKVNLPGVSLLLEADRDMHQLLVAERSLIFANNESDVFKKLVAEYDGNLQQADERWEKYKAIATTAGEKEHINKFEKDRDEWKKISRKVVDGRIADTREGRREALDLSLGLAKQKFEGMRESLDKLTEINTKNAEAAYDAAQGFYRKALMGLFGVIGFGVLAGIGLAWWLGRGITLRLRRVIDGLSSASYQVITASDQVASSSQQLAEGASEQAAAIEETSSSLEEMSSMTRQNADNARQANSMMSDTSQVVREATESMGSLTGAILEISSASEQTQKIIKTIDEIAFQTNLLALNAAVEAARAGEAGAGFAVVADEVRNLAMRAAEAAKNTEALIAGTVTSIRRGTDLVTETSAAFSKVSQGASRVGELVGEISAASSEQAQGIDQVNRAVGEMDTVTQRNAASAEESAAAAQELKGQAQFLEDYVEELAGMVARKPLRSSGSEPLPKADSMKPVAARSGGWKEAKGKVSERRLVAPRRSNGSHGLQDEMKQNLPGDAVRGAPSQVIPFDEDLQEF